MHRVYILRYTLDKSIRYNIIKMSSANAAAKKRRAPASLDPPTPQNRMQQPQPVQNMASPGMTLPQVIALIDKRLVNLETFIADNKKVAISSIQSNTAAIVSQINNITPNTDDFNERFDLLADEIANMKNIILSLQSYTMDVNKVLMEERVRILSEVSSETNLFSFSGETREEPNLEPTIVLNESKTAF